MRFPIILAMVLLAACRGVTDVSYFPSHATHWAVERELYEHYSPEQLERAGEIWCEGTDGEFCPSFHPVMPGEEPNLLLDDGCAKDYACEIGLRILIEATDMGDCLGVTLAHEIGHAIGLQFDEAHAYSSDDPDHTHVSADLMAPAVQESLGVCDDDFELGPVTLQAFERRIAAERIAAESSHVMPDSEGTGPE